MYKSETVFVVGAGASKELDLPSGVELCSDIKTLLTRLNEHNVQHSENSGFLSEMMEFAGQSADKYDDAANRILSGIDSAESIDRFIDRTRENESVRRLGKAAIVRTIVHRERKSKLGQDVGGAYFREHPASPTWISTFVRILLEGRRIEDSIFDQIGIVCFNYDRCIE